MPEIIKRFSKNTAGRDFAVGDIHGHFTRLQAALDAIGFSPTVDRLFSVGDLVDRGPECELVLEWLAKPWFHPVRGNHDDYVCRYDTCDIGNWMQNGGIWFAGLPSDEHAEYAAQFRDIPIAIEVETDEGLIGLVHADCPFTSWDRLRFEFETSSDGKQLKLIRNTCMWSRRRVELGDETVVQGVRAVVCGHTPMREPSVLGNVYHIDTGGWLADGSGRFTILDLSTLKVVAPVQIPDELEG